MHTFCLWETYLFSGISDEARTRKEDRFDINWNELDAKLFLMDLFVTNPGN